MDARAFSEALITPDLAGSGSLFNPHSSLRRSRAALPTTSTPPTSVADSAGISRSPHPTNQPAEGLGMRKPAAAFPEPACWPGTTRAPLPTHPSHF